MQWLMRVLFRRRFRDEALARYVADQVLRQHGAHALHLVRLKMIETTEQGDGAANRTWTRVHRILRK